MMLCTLTVSNVQCDTAFQTGSVPVRRQQVTENTYSAGPEVYKKFRYRTQLGRYFTHSSG